MPFFSAAAALTEEILRAEAAAEAQAEAEEGEVRSQPCAHYRSLSLRVCVLKHVPFHVLSPLIHLLFFLLEMFESFEKSYPHILYYIIYYFRI